MKPDEFLRKYGIEQDGGDEQREHSLRESSWERAVRIHQPNAGTPHDWEDWEHAAEKYGVEVQTTDDTDPTLVHRREHDSTEDLPSVADWVINKLRRLRRRLFRR